MGDGLPNNNESRSSIFSPLCINGKNRYLCIIREFPNKSTSTPPFRYVVPSGSGKAVLKDQDGNEIACASGSYKVTGWFDSWTSPPEAASAEVKVHVEEEPTLYT